MFCVWIVEVSVHFRGAADYMSSSLLSKVWVLKIEEDLTVDFNREDPTSFGHTKAKVVNFQRTDKRQVKSPDAPISARVPCYP